MQISKRLKSLALLVNNGDIIADIGCDHALLDIYLVENNIVPKVLVTDININALNSGIKNIEKYHLENKITAKLGNGIEDITKDINTLIISGMGTSTILKILSHKNIEQINKLIIESNNDYYLLRKNICKKGFYIKDENIIYDKGKYYINIVFLRGRKHYNKKELTFGPILLNGNKDYFKGLYNKNINILKLIPKHKIFARWKLKKSCFFLQKLIKK